MSSISAVEAAAPRVRRRGFPVAAALARVEGRKLLRHPFTIVGALGSLAIPVAVTWKEVPVLNRFDAHTNEALMPFATAVLVAAQLATMRARRNQTTELFDSAPTSQASFVVGHLLSALYAAAAALVLVLIQLTYMKLIGGVTMPRPHVLLIGPALALFAGACGVAIGRWVPRLFAAPVAIAGLVAVCTAVTTNGYAHNREWFSLWVPSEILNGVASELTLRPYGARLVYMLGLALLATGAALAHLRSARVVAGGVIAVAVAIAGVAGARQIERLPRAEKVALAAAFMEQLEDPACDERGSVTYCPMAGYEDWVSSWQPAVEGVLAVAPEGAHPKDLRLLQAPSEAEVYDDVVNFRLVRKLARARNTGILSSESEIYPSLSWGRGQKRGESELALALEVAAKTVGIDRQFWVTKADIAEMPKRYRRQFSPARYQNCGALEQGRAIVALWMAGQATDGTRAAFQRAMETNPYLPERSNSPSAYFDPLQWALSSYGWEALGNGNIMWGTRESAYALGLLAHDRADVKEAIATNWKRLTAPETTADEAAGLLGLPALTSLQAAMKNWGFTPKYQGVEHFGTPACR